MKPYEKLLTDNKAWVKEKLAQDPAFFANLAIEQTPEFLWIGCSDSRVPANEITNTAPGEMFVHRNIANMVVNTDLNVLSVVEYAVEALEVAHIIVCGHYGCGGVKAAIESQSLGIINKWLLNIKDIYFKHKEELSQIEDETKKVNRLVELNVIEQVSNLSKTFIVQNAWAKHQRPVLHGWVYSTSDGILHPLCRLDHSSPMDDIYKIKS